MKIVDNVLSNNSIMQFKIEHEEKRGQYCWLPSDLIWGDNIKDGIVGSCSTAIASDKLKNLIHADISSHLPAHDDIVVQHYVWNKGSGISKHTDQHYEFGATIYMCDNWDENAGGIFMWKEDNDTNWTGLCPKFNTMVINNNKTTHLVTPVSFLTDKPRLTLQIWGLKK